MPRKLFRLVSVVFVIVFLVSCSPLTPYAPSTLQSPQTSTVTPLSSLTPIALPTHTQTKLQDYHDNVVDFSLAPDGRTLVIGTILHTVVLNPETMTVIKTLPISYGLSTFSQDGKILYLSGSNSSSLLLNTENWGAAILHDHDWEYLRYGAGIQVSPNGRTFAFTSGGVPNECDGAHRAFEIRRLYTDEILYRHISCPHYLRIIYKYNTSGDRLFLGWEHGFPMDNPYELSSSNLFAIIDTQNGNAIEQFELSEPVEFIEDNLGVIYLRDRGTEFLLWDINTHDYAGRSKTAKLKLDGNLFLTISLKEEAYITAVGNPTTCKIGKMYGGQNEQESPIVFQFEQANGRLAYFDFMLKKLFYWDILNCKLINTIKLSDISNQ